ncbi:hypothetical protein CEE45_05010 [Candidatus Heimdallarchaeota archaeon B3_Heim]|nr:MAG: hypothetical protein CEE45_05010 [Candidatus Heimdallarchaeota archaeon B3_Heim]
MSNSDQIKKFTVNDDGTLTHCDVSSLGGLQNNAVYIIVDEGLRKIFIWKGEEAPVRRKFISAKAAQQMRQEQYGMVYRIDSLDPGIEGKDFLAIFGEIPSIVSSSDADKAESQVVSRPTTAPSQTTVSTPRPAPTAVPKARPTPAQASVRAPKPAPTVQSTPAPSAAPTPRPSSAPSPVSKPRVVKETEVVVTRQVDATTSTPLSVVAEKLKELTIPSHLTREIVIIGNTVFSVIKEHLQLFSKDVVKLEPMDDLPSGIFPAAHYEVRLYIENGQVLFVDMLREKTRSERDEFIDDMRQSLQDLSKMGL